jgi:hypothetical protein
VVNIGSSPTWKLQCVLRGCSPPALPSLGIGRQTTCAQLPASTIEGSSWPEKLIWVRAQAEGGGNLVEARAKARQARERAMELGAMFYRLSLNVACVFKILLPTRRCYFVLKNAIPVATCYSYWLLTYLTQPVRDLPMLRVLGRRTQ